MLVSDFFLGEIRMFAFDWPPDSWALCNGAAMAIRQNQALFSLFGTIYGGDGQNTFSLPDLRGRVPLHADNVSYRFGNTGGAEQVALTANTTVGIYPKSMKTGSRTLL
jgi:microcystin-dependent protein